MKKLEGFLVAVVGGIVFALGIGLLVLPAPAFMVIPAGLAILALEFAGRGLREARELGRGEQAPVKGKPGALAGSAMSVAKEPNAFSRSGENKTKNGRSLARRLLGRTFKLRASNFGHSAACIITTFVINVQAADQPQWGARHSRNMVSQERSLPATFHPKSGQNIRWEVELGTSTYSTPVIAQGRVLIGTNNGNPRDRRHLGDRCVLMCFDEATGRLHWQLVVPKLPRDPYLDCPRVGLTSSPAVEGERVYLMNNRAEIMALDLHGLANGNDGPFHDESRHAAPFATEPAALGPLDGDILWLTDLRKELEVYPHDSANISVLVVGDHLYVSTPNGVDYTHRHRPSPHAPGLVVLDKRTGRLLARDNTGIGARVFHSSFSSAAFGVVNERPLVFYGGGDGVVYAFEELMASSSRASTAATPAKSLSTLSVAWTFDCDPSAPKENISQFQGNRRESPSSIVGMPVFHEGRIYVTAGGDPWHGKRQCWLKCIDASQRGDVTQSALLWSYPLTRHSISTPSVKEGLVFIADMGRMVHCVDTQTGRAVWTHELDGEVWGSTLVADGKLYVGTHRGTLWVLAASWAKRLLASVDFEEAICTSPVAANGVLYVATMSKLYALAGSASGGPSPHHAP